MDRPKLSTPKADPNVSTANAVEILGAIVLSVGLGLVQIWLGLIAFGISLIGIGILMELF